MNELDLAKQIAQEVEILPEPYRLAAFKVLLQHRLGGSPVSPTSSAHSSRSQSSGLTLREFFKLLEPELKSNPERLAAIAYYLQEYQGASGVTQTEFFQAMRELELRIPRNFRRDMKQAAGRKLDYLMEADPKEGAKAWRLASGGRKFIEQRLRRNQS